MAETGEEFRAVSVHSASWRLQYKILLCVVNRVGSLEEKSVCLKVKRLHGGTHGKELLIRSMHSVISHIRAQE